MVEPARVIHAVVVLIAIGGYSYVFFRGVNNQLSKHMYSVLEEEVQKNPFMKKDLDDYKAQVEEQERQKEHMKELEEQAKKIQEQLQMLSQKKMTVKPPKYIKIEQEEEDRDVEDVAQDHGQPPANKSEGVKVEL